MRRFLFTLAGGLLPSGAEVVAVIQGLCGGEAAGRVFDVSGLGAPGIDQASVGYVNVAGATDIAALVNLVIDTSNQTTSLSDAREVDVVP